jgi:hypothetical protein
MAAPFKASSLYDLSLYVSRDMRESHAPLHAKALCSSQTAAVRIFLIPRKSSRYHRLSTLPAVWTLSAAGPGHAAANRDAPGKI